MYMDTKEAAEYLRMSTRQLNRYVQRDAIPYHAMQLPGNVRRQVRFSKPALDEWMQGFEKSYLAQDDT